MALIRLLSIVIICWLATSTYAAPANCPLKSGKFVYHSDYQANLKHSYKYLDLRVVCDENGNLTYISVFKADDLNGYWAGPDLHTCKSNRACVWDHNYPAAYGVETGIGILSQDRILRVDLYEMPQSYYYVRIK